MLAKRSVPGRSKPYDELILDWKRANIPGFVEPVKRQTKAEKKEQKDREREEKRKMLEAAGVVVGKNAGGKRGAAAAAKKLAAQAALEDQEEMEMDSDVEVESLVRALKSSPVVPMATPDNMGNFFIERNERLRCCGDIMLAALTRGNGGAGFSHGHVGGTFPID
jgi:SAGA-associated factor 73